MAQPVFLARIGRLIRHKEDFHTEALAAILEASAARDWPTFAQLISALSKGKWIVSNAEKASLSIETQVAIPEGRPDLVLRSIRMTMFVEVKVDASVEPGQLHRYRRQLERQSPPGRILVLLARWNEALGPDDEPDVRIMWHEIEAATRSLATTARDKGVSVFLEEMSNYLRGRNMAREPITGEIEAGTKALWRLLGMLFEALTVALPRAEVPTRRVNVNVTGGWIGYLTRNRFWSIGLEFDNPRRLLFASEPQNPTQLREAFSLELGTDVPLTGVATSAQEAVLREWLQNCWGQANAAAHAKQD